MPLPCTLRCHASALLLRPLPLPRILLTVSARLNPMRSQLAPTGFDRTIGMLGSAAGLFEFPRGVAVSSHGWLLVAEPQRVQCLTLLGAPLQVLNVPGASVMRGIACDDVRGCCYVADYDAHLLHVLKMDLLAAADHPAPPKPEPSAKGWTSELVGDGHVAAAKEATERIKSFMAGRPVAFNGAGEAGLREVSQAWSVHHTDETARASNAEALKGIADILQEYPALYCEVHGETGVAKEAPGPLARHLGLHALDDVGEIMTCLARFRAQACVDALVAHGVPEGRLYVSATGMGGGVGVEFIPQGAAAAARLSAAPLLSPSPTASACSFLNSTFAAPPPPLGGESSAAGFLASGGGGGGGEASAFLGSLSKPLTSEGSNFFGSLADVEKDESAAASQATGADFLSSLGGSAPPPPPQAQRVVSFASSPAKPASQEKVDSFLKGILT